MKEHDLYKEITDDLIVDMKKVDKYCLQDEGEIVTMKKHKIWKKRTMGIAAAVACVVLICMPVMAKELIKIWDHTVASIFGADSKIQQEYQNTNLTQVFETSETENMESEEEDLSETKAVTVADNNGVMVSLTQTIADDYSMYIYLEVKTDGTISLTDNNLFEYVTLYVDGKPWAGYDNMGGGFVEDEYAVSEYERGFELRYLNSASDGINLGGHDVRLELSNLQADAGKLDMYTIAEGSWQLQWKVEGQYSGEVKTLDLENTVITVGEGTYTLKDIDISPISYYMHYENHGVDSFETGPLNIAFIMKDGTIYDDENNPSEDNMLACGAGGYDLDSELITFVKVLNLSELKAIRINGTVFDIK